MIGPIGELRPHGSNDVECVPRPPALRTVMLRSLARSSRRCHRLSTPLITRLARPARPAAHLPRSSVRSYTHPSAAEPSAKMPQQQQDTGAFQPSQAFDDQMLKVSDIHTIQ